MPKTSRSFPWFAALLLLLSAGPTGALEGQTSDAITDIPAPYQAAEPRYSEVTRRSFHLGMRDGVRIALDVWLPAGREAEAKLPTILHQTRYWRSSQLVWPIPDQFAGREEAAEFVERGYAWVSVDARGSGASFGSRPYPWSGDETRDGAEVVDWIVAQPWSNGRVGTFGTSYDGSTAEFLVVNEHPAVVAAAPRFSLFDAYADIAFPGGIRLDWFTQRWAQFNHALDRNTIPADLKEELGWRRWLLKGVRPVDGDDGDALLEAAVAAHADNWDVHELATGRNFRDDANASGETVDVFSPFTYAEPLDDSGTPIYSWSGWFDGGYAHAAIKRHLTLKNPANRLILGPWTHGGIHQVRGAHSSPTEFDHTGQLLKFFDHYVGGEDTGIENDAPVHYYTMVEGRWKAAAAWPPASKPVRLYLSDAGSLSPDAPPVGVHSDRHSVDPTHGTGDASRWNSLMGLAVDYPDRAAADTTLLVYDTPALDRDFEVTGHPVITLYVASSAQDGAFFVYLEDVGPDGSVTYVTEGQLRALHRKLSTTPAPYRQVVPYRSFRREDGRPMRPGQISELVIDLLPTSYLFREGHRIRVALAGADADHFAAIPDGAPPTWEVQRSRSHPSHIMLPVVVAD
jgi:putative CocE/NonD family hydrolase